MAINNETAGRIETSRSHVKRMVRFKAALWLAGLSTVVYLWRYSMRSVPSYLMVMDVLVVDQHRQELQGRMSTKHEYTTRKI